MSRLWISHTSDLRKRTGHGASETATASIHWGSSKDSKLAAHVFVHWPKGSKVPSVTIESVENGIYKKSQKIKI
jgi:hypothetical protein